MKKETNIPFEEVLDGTNQLIQICYKDDLTMLYANSAAKSFTKNKGDYKGMKCHKFMMGLDAQCPFCPILKMNDEKSLSINVDNGVQVFSVQTNKINIEGKEAFIEYASDITQIYRAQEVFELQMKTLLDSIPDAQGIFHFDLTNDNWLSSNGISNNAKEIKRANTVNENIKTICSFIPDENQREELYSLINREALIKSYNNGNFLIKTEVQSYYDDNSIRFTMIAARTIRNPKTGSIEAVIYGNDISNEKKLQEKVKAVTNEKKQIELQAKLDFLTPLLNKTTFENELNRIIKEHTLNSSAILFMDLDNFKEINDNLGHFVGDRAIIESAEKLKKLFNQGEIISRFGGDEFCVFLENIEYNQLIEILKKMLLAFDCVYKDEENKVHITTSIGVVYQERKIKNAHDIIDRADKALYQAKRDGRNCYHIVKNI